MSKDNSSVRSFSRSNPISHHLEENENESDNLGHYTPHPPSRTPFNSIPDPSQLHRPIQDLPQVVLDNQPFVLSKGNGTTPRVSTRGGKPHSEPNSAQSTPAKGIPRVSNVGGRGGSSSGASRRISIARTEPVILVPHFELVENPSFWKDHNVQVLIRIRPLNNIEKVSQEYGKCLRQESAQTLVWLGHPETRFTFDHVACETLSQEKLFKVAGLPIVENCMSGYNSCIFAYGQTGSGKTYTMMGEIYQMEGKLHEDCGMTPRIFEYLFKRIREEEDKRWNERLKYSCKCSFLEIYNEQITDLLEPSSTNLQLREDLKKGVYVENLTEYSVRTVDDVLRLLLRGAANRKMAATHMNSESSRSHSVFTCIIESCWEKDSMTHLRFGRLNLVDLAGSERRKSSGAEGDRLKEAANINKSLSTLGLVIMSLVDLAHGKHRHVPYRDSRLTFLLQDSLGGNSKTTIIANVSPSICSANETLSTLKFAQRAKLIQNNAKINEDASGDVTALQQQIQQLKDQLSFLLKHQKSSEECSRFAPNFEESILDAFPERSDSSEKMNMVINHKTPSCRGTKLMCMEGTLLGALRREKLSEFEVKRLKEEIEQINILVHHQEEDAQHTKMILSLRNEKIKRLELLADGLISADKYLLDENNALREEIELLEARIQKNPELVQLALEKNRILDQLRLIQDFYEQGERETLLAEISDLRDQFLKVLEVEGSSGHTHVSTSEGSQENSIAKELEELRDANPKLVRSYSCREDEQFQKERKDWNQPTCGSVMPPRNDVVDEMMPFSQPENGVLQCEDGQKMENELVLQFNDIQKELTDSRSLLEAMESEQIRLIEELEFMRNENDDLREILQNRKIGGTNYRPEPGSCDLQYSSAEENDLTLVTKDKDSASKMLLQAKLKKLSRDLNEGQLISYPYPEDHVLQMSCDHQIELVQNEVEMETTKTILQLQEEITILQSELQERLHSMAEENASLRNTVAAKDDEIRQLSTEWERATLELTTFLTDGSKSLKDAASQVESITCLFPRVNVWISEHVERAAKLCIEKEENILLLKKSLEDAQKTVLEMDQKLNSLKGVTIALTECQQLEDGARRMEKLQSSTLQNHKFIVAKHVENKIMYKRESKSSADRCVLSTSFELKSSDEEAVVDDDEMDAKLTNPNASVLADMDIEMELACFGLLEVDNCIKASCLNAENHFSFLQSAIHEAFSLHKNLILDLVNDIHDIRRSFAQMNTNYGNVQINTARSQSICSYEFLKHENQKEILYQVRDELVRISNRLTCLNASFCGVVDTYESLATAESLEEADGWSTESSTSSSKSSAVSVTSENRSNINSSSGYHNSNKKNTEQLFEQGVEEGAIFSSDYQDPEESEKLVKSSSPDEATLFCLQKELRAACDAFSKIYALLTAEFCSKDTLDGSAIGHSVPHSPVFLMNNEQHLIKNGHELVITPEKGKMVQGVEEMVREDEFIKQFNPFDKITQADRFFTKFEKAQSTMKEADHMLKALMKANENAKQLASMWKQTGEELMLEKENLVEEIEQLKSSINLKDRENELWQEQIHFELMEIVNLALLLKGSLQQDTEDICRRVYSDATVMVKDALNSICGFRSLLEDIFSKLMENEILSFVLHHWHLEELDCESRSLNMHSVFHSSLEEASTAKNNLAKSYKNFGNESMVDLVKSRMKGYQTEIIRRSEAEDRGLVHDDLIIENLELKRELQRKEVILKGLFFDFSLLQESATSRTDAKDEIERLTTALNQVEHELKLKISQFDDLVIQHRTLEDRLTEAESALSISNSDLEQVRGTLDILSEQNADFRMLLKDLYLQKSEAEQQLEEQRETMKDLENEILRMASSVDKKLASSVTDINDDLQRMTIERDELLDQLHSLQDRLDIANALADEKEAIALEARQESEASKVYAEQKEEEVKILEHSVEELEYTINVLEKKVYEMEEEVERHRRARDALEVELQALRKRLRMVESITDDLDSTNSSREPSESQFSRKWHGGYVELQEFHNQIRVLEEEKARLAEEVKQYRDYISELVVHAEAQSSQYQQKYKNLEAMVQEVKTDSSNGISEAATSDKTEKISVRVRGSSSPFRCISNLVQQMNLEKDQELSIAKLRIEELEALLASRQKKVCLVNTRLAAVESMTHDVIRDLLGVKLDMTNYADLISQNRLQKLVEEAQQQKYECTAMEKEVFNLRSQITDLIEERKRCILEVKTKEADMLTVNLTLEQLRERDQLLAAQNEMLKADKTNLQRRVAELDDMVKKLIGTQNTEPRNRQQMNSLSMPKDNNHGKRQNHSENPLPRWNNVRTDSFTG